MSTPSPEEKDGRPRQGLLTLCGTRDRYIALIPRVCIGMMSIGNRLRLELEHLLELLYSICEVQITVIDDVIR